MCRKAFPNCIASWGGKGNGVGIDPVKGEVHNSAWAAFMLGDYARGTNPKIWQVVDGIKG